MTNPHSTTGDRVKLEENDDMVKRLGRVGSFAQGNYMCNCVGCGVRFSGDKRALHCLPCAVAGLQASRMAASSEGEEIKRLKCVIERDRTKVAMAVAAIQKAVDSREHLREPGRGPFEWDDEQYQREFGDALDEISVPVDALRKIAHDWSDALPTGEAIFQARLAARPDAGRTRPLLDKSDLANCEVIDHPDAYLGAALDFSRSILAHCVAAGLKARDVADGFQHLESAIRGLHARALRPASTPQVAVPVSEEMVERIGRRMRDEYMRDECCDYVVINKLIEALSDALDGKPEYGERILSDLNAALAVPDKGEKK